MDEWTIAVDGAAIFAMPPEKRCAKIVEPIPRYTIDEQAPNSDKQKVKLIMYVLLSDGRRATYYPNRTSARKIASVLGTDLSSHGMAKWLGHTVYWGKILDQMVGGSEKKVLYVTDVKLIV